MPTNCYQGTNTPPLSSEPCNGCYTSSKCIIHSAALIYLNLPANSSLETIITNLLLAHVNKDNLISNLEARVTALENEV